ncbi:MAG: hypothetical protein Q9191_000611 [Dirinaria sp. TL-2023a]
MANIDIPAEGLTFQGSPAPLIHGDGLPKTASTVKQAMRLDLDEGVLQGILRTARSGGKGVHVSFGKSITLHYGNRSKQLAATTQHARTELYSYSFETVSQLKFTAVQSHRLAMKKAEGDMLGADAALTKLQASLASHEREKQSRHSAAKKLLQRSHLKIGATQSTPANSSFETTGSPRVTSGPTSPPPVEDSKVRKYKAIRTPLIHFLAVRPVSEKYLAQTLGCDEADCRGVLEKVGKEYRLDKSKWDLNDKFYKELDPYQFPYPSQDDRQLAIDRAVSAHDRQRIAPSDQLWQKLLPFQERGKGKCLSMLELKKKEAARAQKAMTPRINVQATEDASTGRLTPSNDSDTRLDRLAPSDAEPKIRSGSSRPANKSKPGDREAQTKKSVSKNPIKPTKVQKSKAKPLAKAKEPKTGAKKGTQTKPQAISSEFVHDSDEEEDEDMTDASMLQKQDNRSRDTPVSLQNPQIPATVESMSKDSLAKTKLNKVLEGHQKKPSTPHIQTADKRPPTSSSLCPDLTNKHSDSSQAPAAKPQTLSRQRTTSSPHKPSPLGSSPPANASDLDNESHILSSSSSTPLITKPRNPSKITSLQASFAMPNDSKSIGNTSERCLKRKASDIDSDIHEHNDSIHIIAPTNGLSNCVKRSRTSPTSPPTSDSGSSSSSNARRRQTIEDALRFKSFYKKYEQLYQEVTGLPKDTPNPKFDELMKMHNKLSGMKADIAKASTPRKI